jgi:hypothetical protein
MTEQPSSIGTLCVSSASTSWAVSSKPVCERLIVSSTFIKSFKLTEVLYDAGVQTA